MKKLIPFIAIALLLASCKVQKPQNGTAGDSIPIKSVQNSLKTYIVNISGSYNSIPFKGTVRLQKDSLLWFSVTGFGFEVMRGLLTQDSIFVINKVEKEVVIGDYALFERHFGMPLTFSVVQQVLLDTTESRFQSPNQADIIFIPQGTTQIESFYFPKQITAKAKLNNRMGEITVKFNNQQINQLISTPISVPSSYRTLK